VLAAGTAVGVVALLVAGAGLALDHRVITGAPAWLKPAKFAVSITAYVATLRWMLSSVSGHRRLLGTISAVTVLALAGELLLIDVQVVRGTTSHFNAATPFDAAVFSAMGLLISAVFLLAALAGVLVLRQRGLDAGLAAGIRWGLAVSLLGMAEAMLMISNHGWNPTGGHTVGAPDGGPGLPVIGWSTAHGDLRAAHFVGLHALQALPLLAWVLARRTGLDGWTRARLVGVAGSAQAALVGLLAWQALRGQALLRPDGATVLAAGVLAVLAGAGAGLVLRAGRRRAAVTG
jgi:hypothetical protein